MRLRTSVILTLLLLTAAATQTVYGQATPTPGPAAAGWQMAHLSQARQQRATATVGHRVLFAGGWSGENSARQWLDIVDIYDDETGAWSTTKLSAPRPVDTLAVVGDLAIFASSVPGGATDPNPARTVDIYDAANDSWSVAHLSSDQPISGVVVAGTRVLFVASGNQVDIYDTATGQWSAQTLATSRTYPAVAAAGQQVVIVGTTMAIPKDARTSASPDARTPVDIYDAATDRWLTAELSDTRWRDVSTIGLGDRVYVAGGGIGTDIFMHPVVSDAVDVYDATTGGWSTMRLSQARMGILPVVAGQQVLFAGGYTGFSGPARDVNWTRRVDVYDSATNGWSTAELTAGWRFTGFAVGDLAVFAGGYRGARSVVTPSRQADAYDSQTGAWSHQEALHQQYNEMLTAVALGPLGLVVSSKNVDVYDTSTGRWSTLPLPENRGEDPVATVGSRLLVPGSDDVVYIHDFDAPPP